MGDQCSLYLHGRDPLTTDLEHVVGTTAVPVVAIGILIVFVTGVNPVAVDYVFGLFVLVPVVGGCAISLNQ